MQRREEEVGNVWSKILDDALNASATAKKIDVDIVNKVKNEVKLELLKEVEVLMQEVQKVQEPERLNDSDL